ncbi:MAG: hypothetical protein KKF44_01425 [Nanoarchaeota archaeon]|nr:hypothetical protein [Nanoarchaeota archaeon]
MAGGTEEFEAKRIEEIIDDWTEETFTDFEKKLPFYQRSLESIVSAICYCGSDYVDNALEHFTYFVNSLRKTQPDSSLIYYGVVRYFSSLLLDMMEVIYFMDKESEDYETSNVRAFLDSIATNIDVHTGFKREYDEFASGDEEPTLIPRDDKNFQTYQSHTNNLSGFLRLVEKDNDKQEKIMLLNELIGTGGFWLPGITNTRVHYYGKGINASPFNSWLQYLSYLYESYPTMDIDYDKMHRLNSSLVEKYLKTSEEQKTEIEDLLSLFSYHFITGDFKYLNNIIWNKNDTFTDMWNLNENIRDHYYSLYWQGNNWLDPTCMDEIYTEEIHRFKHVLEFVGSLIHKYKFKPALPIISRFLDITMPSWYNNYEIEDLDMTNTFIQSLAYSIIQKKEISLFPLNEKNAQYPDDIDEYVEKINLCLNNKYKTKAFKTIDSRLDFFEGFTRRIRIFDELNHKEVITPEVVSSVLLKSLDYPHSAYISPSEKTPELGFFDDFSEDYKKVERELSKHDKFINEMIKTFIASSSPIKNGRFSRHTLDDLVTIPFDKFYELDHMSSRLYRDATFMNPKAYWLLRAQNFLYEKEDNITKICPRTNRSGKAVFVAMGGGTLDEELFLIFKYLENNIDIAEVVIYNVENSYDMAYWTDQIPELEDRARGLGGNRKVKFKVFPIQKNFLDNDFNLVFELEKAAQNNFETLNDIKNYEMYFLALTNLPGNLPEDISPKVRGQKALIQRMADAAHMYKGKMIVGTALEGDPTNYQSEKNKRVSERPLRVLGIPEGLTNYKPNYNKKEKRWEFKFEFKREYMKTFKRGEDRIEVVFPEGYEIMVEPFSRRYTTFDKRHEDYFYVGDLLGTDFTTTSVESISSYQNAQNLSLDSTLLAGRKSENLTIDYLDWQPFICDRSDLKRLKHGENIEKMSDIQIPDETQAYALFTYDFAPA